MYKLAEHVGGVDGAYCGKKGMFLGDATLIRCSNGIYHVHPVDVVAALIDVAYQQRPETRPDISSRFSGLQAVAKALQEDNLPLAQIAAVQLRLGPIAPERMVAIRALLEAGQRDFCDPRGNLIKAGFNPAELRDPRGRWSDAGSVMRRPILPAQELLPLDIPPSLFFDEPPEVIRPFKEPIPRLSGKEAARDIPSWARGGRPYVGESGRDFARRLMDERYGRGSWRTNDSEFRRLQKYGDRAFRDPRAIVAPGNSEGEI